MIRAQAEALERAHVRARAHLEWARGQLVHHVGPTAPVDYGAPGRTLLGDVTLEVLAHAPTGQPVMTQRVETYFVTAEPPESAAWWRWWRSGPVLVIPALAALTAVATLRWLCKPEDTALVCGGVIATVLVGLIDRGWWTGLGPKVGVTGERAAQRFGTHG